MYMRACAATGLLVCSALGLAEWSVQGAPAAGKDRPDAPGNELFGLTRVHEFHLELSAGEWEKMQQVTGGFPMFGQPKKAPEKPPEKPGAEPIERHKNLGFGMEFPWAKGELTAAGKTYRNLGIRYKGNGSYVMSGGQLRRNFKIELDHYDDDLRFQGLKTINLNAGAMDPLRMREALAYALFRTAGVPAPRTAFAEVSLTVAGKYDKEFLGLYTFVEQVDKSFLKDRFKTTKGLLMKPERMRAVEYYGENWEPYQKQYNPKRDPTKAEQKRIIAFARLVNKADDEQFQREIGSYLETEGFLRFLAVNAYLANMDSFLLGGHNYLIYLDPTTHRFQFLPWDLDLAFAGFPLMGTPDQQMDLSLIHPHVGQLKLIDRVLAVPELKERYQKLLKEFSATCFAKEALLKDVEAVEKITGDILVRETRAAQARKGGFGPPGGGPFPKPPELRTFVEKRSASVTAQLAGTSKGWLPAMDFGPGGPGGPGGFGPGNFLAKPLLQALDTDKDGKLSSAELASGIKTFFQDCDKDRKGTLDVKQLAEGINRIMPMPKGFGPPAGDPAKPPPGPPPGFGPGNFFAPAILKRAEPDREGKVTLARLLAAADALFMETDKDRKGSLDEKQVTAAINRVLAPPPQFGPAGPGLGDPKKDGKKSE